MRENPRRRRAEEGAVAGDALAVETVCGRGVAADGIWTATDSRVMAAVKMPLFVYLLAPTHALPSLPSPAPVALTLSCFLSLLQGERLTLLPSLRPKLRSHF